VLSADPRRGWATHARLVALSPRRTTCRWAAGIRHGGHLAQPLVQPDPPASGASPRYLTALETAAGLTCSPASQVGSGQVRFLRGHQQRQDPGRHPGETHVGQGRGRLLDKSRDGLLVAWLGPPGSRRATARLSHCGLPHPNSVSGMTNVVELTGVVKRFGTVTVLDGLDLAVTEGEVHGFLGPNGAGKTTTLRLLLGLLRPNAGSIRVLGLDPWRNVATLHRRLAYVPGDVALWPNLTGGEVIDLLGRLQGGQDQARRDRLLEMFDLDPTKKARTYSKGNRQKVALIAALATDAEVFLLDEPTSGLDPLMEESFRGCARDLRDAGRTILLSSHILSEAEALSDRISIIRAGKVVETGRLEQLRHLTRTSVTADVAAVPQHLELLPGVHDVVVANHRVSAQVEPAGLAPLMQALTAAGLQTLTSSPPTLEDLFLRHYGAATGQAPTGAAASGGRPDNV